MFKDLVTRTRSIRRFDESYQVTEETLRDIVELARLSPSGANMQPLKFILVTNSAQAEAVFESIRFAAYLKDWSGPQQGERPTAYIIILGDLRIKRQFDMDAGIAAQSMMLGLTELGLGGCMMGSYNREKITRLFELEPVFEIVLVIAIGKPAEQVVIEPLKPGDDIKYYRDTESVHHVPKRSLDDIIL